MPRRRRRWLSYSLRSLLLLTMLVAIVLGFWVHPGKRQRQVVATIREAGGKVGYEGEPARLAHIPRWLRIWLGQDYFTDVVYVGFDHTNGRYTSATDTLVLVRELTKLRELRLGQMQVNDAELVHLRGLTKLERLYLNGTAVSDVGIEHLAGLTNLRTLDLTPTAVSDAGLAHLRGLTKLEILYLDGTSVTDAGIVHLTGLTKLKILVLANTQVTHAGFDKLRRAIPSCKVYQSRWR